MKGKSEEILLHYADKIIDLCSRKDIAPFDGFVPVIPDLFDEEYFIFTDVRPSDLAGKVNVSALRLGDPNKSDASSEAQFFRLKALSAKELRKKAGVFSINPFMVQVAFEKFPQKTDAFFTGTKNGFKAIEIPNYAYNPVTMREALLGAQIALGIQFNLENQCYVYLRPENAPIGFKYPIDNLQQLRELFSLRDVPDGLKRRAALRHWVARHMRRAPRAEEKSIEVKHHLRGRESFDWFGIRGTIFINQDTI